MDTFLLQPSNFCVWFNWELGSLWFLYARGHIIWGWKFQYMTLYSDPLFWSCKCPKPAQPSWCNFSSVALRRRLLLCRLSYEAFASFLCKVHIWSGGWLVCGFEQVSQLTESGQVHFIWISAGFLIKKYCQSSGMEGLSSLHDDVPKVALFHFSLGFLRWMDVNSLVYI